MKALETLLSLFDDVIDTSERVMMQPSEFRVFQNYISPLIKKLMDTTKTNDNAPGNGHVGWKRIDQTVRHAIAINLARITKVGIRCIEIAQASSIQLREEIRQRKINASKSEENKENKGMTEEIKSEDQEPAFYKRSQSMLDNLMATR